jgi:hypothetical protein
VDFLLLLAIDCAVTAVVFFLGLEEVLLGSVSMLVLLLLVLFTGGCIGIRSTSMDDDEEDQSSSTLVVW